MVTLYTQSAVTFSTQSTQSNAVTLSPLQAVLQPGAHQLRRRLQDRGELQPAAEARHHAAPAAGVPDGGRPGAVIIVMFYALLNVLSLSVMMPG